MVGYPAPSDLVTGGLQRSEEDTRGGGVVSKAGASPPVSDTGKGQYNVSVCKPCVLIFECILAEE